MKSMLNDQNPPQKYQNPTKNSIQSRLLIHKFDA